MSTHDERLKDFYKRQELFDRDQKVRDLKNRIDSLEEVIAILLEVEREVGTTPGTEALMGAEILLNSLRDELFLKEIEHGI